MQYRPFRSLYSCRSHRPCPTCGDTITGPGLPSAPEKAESNTPSSPTPTSPIAEEKPAAPPTPEPKSETSPTSEPSKPPSVSATGDTEKIGRAPIAFIALLAISTAFFLGFLAGQKKDNEAQVSSKPSPNSTTLEPTKKKPEKTPLVTPETAENLIEQLPPKESTEAEEPIPLVEETSAAKTTLLAFLTAPDWTSRLVYVLHPDQVASKMEAIAKEIGDGPIPYQEIMTVGLGKPEAEVFGVATEKYPGGIPVAVKKIDGQWLIDWAAFAEFYYDGFRTFAESPSGYEGIFRVQVAPVDEKPGHYTLSPPTAGKVYEAKVNPESSVNEQIESVMNFYKENSPEQFEAAMQQGGANFMLKVSRQDEGAEQIIFIEDVVAVGWAPRDTEDN